MSRGQGAAAALAVCAAVVVSACGPVEVDASAKPISAAQSSSTQPKQGSETSATETSARESTTGGQPSARIVEPDNYVQKGWSTSDSQATTDVPAGWAETPQNAYKSDFVDATGQAKLRVDFTAALAGGSDETCAEAADAELHRLQGAAGFHLLARRNLDATATQAGGVQIVYDFTKDGQTVQATFQFLGGGDSVLLAVIGIFTPPDQAQLAMDVLDIVHEHIDWR